MGDVRVGFGDDDSSGGLRLSIVFCWWRYVEKGGGDDEGVMKFVLM